MNDFNTFADNVHDPYGEWTGANHPRDTTIQIIISVALGISTFLAFCILRPRWTGLYAARKRTKNAALVLPELPDTMFGWIIPLWNVTDQQVLASGGLDAYVFLAFFKMAMKFLAITLFFSLVVIQPVHNAFPEEPPRNISLATAFKQPRSFDIFSSTVKDNSPHDPYLPDDFENHYLWIYVIFAYVFSAVTIWLIIVETKRIIAVRQEYLGTSTTVTDRTIKLSGIPKDLQDEEKLKEFFESLDIGKVERITLCRNWQELDDSMAKRMDILRRLEEAYTVFHGRRRARREIAPLPTVQPGVQTAVAGRLIDHEEITVQAEHQLNAISRRPLPEDSTRPRTRIWVGRFKLQSKSVDAIEHYEEQLRRIDVKIISLRKSKFVPTALAFVTLDSVATCQMAMQAVLDPSPMQLIASQSPAPSDVIWNNTYMSRRRRMIRSWTITVVIVFFTVFWSVIFAFVAGLLTTDIIGKVFPQLEDFLEKHKNVQSLVNTQLPTIMTSILLVLVPYLYYWLSWYQGMISQGDIELSAISKNFFFTFFNFFIVFTMLGTASKFYQFFDKFREVLKDFRQIAYTLASSLQKFLNFYVDFIILQGVGLFPFRLLEAGSVSLYPIYRLGAKTPRDYAELIQPPIFSYGFYLPSALLIFIICMVYSVHRSSWTVLLPGLIYFSFGHFVYKYQLLYAMDHQQASTGRAWGMICDRIFIGLIFFQITTLGQLLLQQAYARTALVVPLVIATIWLSISYGRTYKPLMKFIALRSIKRGESYSDQPLSPTYPASMASSINELAPERNVWADVGSGAQQRYRTEVRHRYYQAVDESPEAGMRFINPSLVAPLKGVWIADNKSLRDGGGVAEDGRQTTSAPPSGHAANLHRDLESLAEEPASDTEIDGTI